VEKGLRLWWSRLTPGQRCSGCRHAVSGDNANFGLCLVFGDSGAGRELVAYGDLSVSANLPPGTLLTPGSQIEPRPSSASTSLFRRDR
jgi:hypothetical protein